MRNPVYCDDLTPTEAKIYRAIIFEGLGIKDLCKRFYLARSTIMTHINSICHKKQAYGYCRLFVLSSQFWREFIKMKNCTKCLFCRDEKCYCAKSQEYKGIVNEYMICREFKEKDEKKTELH